MLSPVFMSLQVLVCALVVFASLGNAIVPLPASRPVPVAASPVPVALDTVPEVFTPSKRGSGSGSSGSGSGGRPVSGSGSRSGSGRNNRGGSRSGRKTLPKPKTLPREEEITIEEDASAFAIGSYEDEDGDEHALFENFDDHNLAFYSKMYDFFAAKVEYLPTGTQNPYEDATETQDPFRSGGWEQRPTGKPIKITGKASKPDEHPVTAKFDPTDSEDACRAWSTLRDYCGAAGTHCACYSGTYWVPDQWNSLAGACADVTSKCGGTDAHDDDWCQFGSTAYDFNTYCPDLPADETVTSARFAQFANIADDDNEPSTPSEPSPPDEPSEPDSSPSEEETTTSEDPVVVETTSSSSTPAINPAQTTTDSSLVYIFSTGFPSDFPACLPTCLPNSTPTATGSWSPRSLDPVLASVFAWCSLLATMVLL